MKSIFQKLGMNKLMAILVVVSLSFTSCEDKYPYDNSEPDWLGESIYDYLKEDGNFTTYVRMIEDLGYKEVFQLTGSKTLFVADDDAFEDFFTANDWGVTKYEDLSTAQKKLILNFSIINNAYLIETLSNYYSGGTFFEGTAMRRSTNLSPVDSIAFDMGDELPTSKYFDSHRTSGMFLMKDATVSPAVYFTEKFLSKNNITNEDVSFLAGSIFGDGSLRERNDVHLFDVKIIDRDITCKNGYIHIMDKVLIPHTNMAYYIQKNPETRIFSKLLDRFCAPYYDEENTLLMKKLDENFNDSIFVKKYFASNGGVNRLPDANFRPLGSAVTNLLPFDPGWNSYYTSAIQADMATMFVPSDEAMTNFLNSGVGELLKSRFGEWDSIPDKIILPLIRRHMRASLIESVPSKFEKMVDGENYKLPVLKSHIQKAYTAVNGEVFVTSEVYAPVDYISVYSPVLLSENTRIADWAINRSEISRIDNTPFAFYKLYLNSLVSTYSLLIPVDDALENYVDPITLAHDIPTGVKFEYFNEATLLKPNTVSANLYRFDKSTGLFGDTPEGLIESSKTNTDINEYMTNRLWDLLSCHTVVGDISSGKEFYITKSNDIIRVKMNGTVSSVQGGDDMVNNTSANITRVFNQQNGKTYLLDKSLQPTRNSVYKTLESNPEFSAFFGLLSDAGKIFEQKGIDFNVAFFNAYHYTVYVPTNAAIQQAIADGKLKTWDDINAIADPAIRNAETEKMIRFLRYHFQDNAVFFGQEYNAAFQSATIKLDGEYSYFNTSKNKYYKIGVSGSSNSMTLTTELHNFNGVPHQVHVTALHNLIAKDYRFSVLPSTVKDITGTNGGAKLLADTRIESTASAVIHQIDDILVFE